MKRLPPITQRGLTLIEMIVVLVLFGILGGIGASFIYQALQSQLDIGRRAQLVDEADTILTLMVREIRRALPNSVRPITGAQGIEFIPTLTGGRYRARVRDNGTGGDILDAADFEVLSRLERDPTNKYLVIYNASTDWSYRTSPINRVQITNCTDCAFDNQWVNNTQIMKYSKTFDYPSPNQRFQVVDQPIAYVCQDGVITRYENYGFRDTPTIPTTGGAILASHIQDCAISYQAGSDTRNGLVRLTLSLSRDGETVTLFKRAPVLNTP